MVDARIGRPTKEENCVVLAFNDDTIIVESTIVEPSKEENTSTLIRKEDT